MPIGQPNAGQQTHLIHLYIDAATCASYCAVAVISLLGGPLASRMGIKGMLIAGAATFAINGSGKL